MILQSWTPAYSAPSVSGVTKGTLSVPTIIRPDWALKSEEPNSVSYLCSYAPNTAYPGSLGNVELKCSTISNPYAWDKQNAVPLSYQVPGLTAKKVYIRYTALGSAADADKNEFIIPFKTSIALEVPSACSIDVADIQEQVAITLAFLSNAVTEGTVQPLSKVPAMCNGALLL